jgi:hypothetical protein
VCVCVCVCVCVRAHDSNNEQEASSTRAREPSVKKIRQTKSTILASSANQMLLQKRLNKKRKVKLNSCIKSE